jgi:hypothetical protein
MGLGIITCCHEVIIPIAVCSYLTQVSKACGLTPEKALIVRLRSRAPEVPSHRDYFALPTKTSIFCNRICR